MPDTSDNSQNKYRRLTIGFIDEDTINENHNIMVNSIRRTAQEYNADVIRFGHMRMDLHPNSEYSSTLLNFVRHFKLDGLIFLGWTQYASSAIMRIMGNMPVICIGEERESIHSVFFAGDEYIEEIMNHLICEHGRKNIAFVEPIRSDTRSDIYKKVMQKYGIYDPELFISADDLEGRSVNLRGKRVVELLLDERKAHVDAIVSSYNDETYDIMAELNARRIRVPEDIAVTSYEDSEIARNMLPSCTTVYFPWDELGSCACELLCKWLNGSTIPMSVKVQGKVLYRESCGCTLDIGSNSDFHDIRYDGKCFEELNDSELSEISWDISKRTFINKEATELLIKLFKDYFYSRTNLSSDIDIQFISFAKQWKNSDVYKFVPVFRGCLLPYLLPYAEKDINRLLWAEDIFNYMHKALHNSIVSVWFREENDNREIHNTLKEIGQILITNFTLNNLLDSIELNLPRIMVKSCIIYMAENVKNNEFPGSLNKIFEYSNGKRTALPDIKNNKSEYIALSQSEQPYFVTAQLLYMEYGIKGIVLFEPTVMDVRIYNTLAEHICSAMNGTALFDELEIGYKLLMDQARKKGMADISTGVLHNIGNVLNSINVTVQTLKELIETSPTRDLSAACEMLEKHMDDLEGFMRDNPKGELLMQFYSALGDCFKSYYDKLRNNISKLAEKISIVNDIIFAQQKYTIIKPVLEPLDLSAIISDALKLYESSIQKHSIKVEIDYRGKTVAIAYSTKLFDVLANLVKNAIESMEGISEGIKTLKVSVENINDNVLITISDTGAGIEESSLESIFNYGFTTKEKGHGFGLHSCANYMREMNGKIWVESQGAGKGATFILQLRAKV